MAKRRIAVSNPMTQWNILTESLTTVIVEGATYRLLESQARASGVSASLLLAQKLQDKSDWLPRHSEQKFKKVSFCFCSLKAFLAHIS